MRIIAKKTIREFWEKHPDAEEALKTWHREVSGFALSTPKQMLDHIRNTRFIGSDRYVFNICGNKYRIIARIDFSRKVLFIRFIGTHAEYDTIDPKQV